MGDNKMKFDPLPSYEHCKEYGLYGSQYYHANIMIEELRVKFQQHSFRMEYIKFLHVWTINQNYVVLAGFSSIENAVQAIKLLHTKIMSE